MPIMLLAIAIVSFATVLMSCQQKSTLDAAPPVKPPGQVSGQRAKSADAFVNSTCVNTHWRYFDTPYGNFQAVKRKLLELGVRHVRDGGTSDDFINKTKELARSGVKTTFVLDPKIGVAPNELYWVNEPHYYIKDFVKNKVGTNAIDAVEVLNEIDLFHDQHGGYRWKPDDEEKVNDDPNSPLYWVDYARSVTKDTWGAIKSDRATAGVKVIGPSLGRPYSYESKSPLRDLSAYVDWGNFHPYPHGGNTYNPPFRYNSIAKYYWQGNFPSANLDNYPLAFDLYRPPFGSKPMAATETGYFTGTENSRAITERVHGKYIPRLFLEYFRKNITRTCLYEFVDEFKNPGWSEANYGLLRNNLSPKPGYTALKNLIGLLKDPGKSFTPGALDYKLSFKPPRGYNRTEYIHDLLLQKRNGDFYLVLWHEISNGDTSGKRFREINPPAMPTTVAFKKPLGKVTVYSLDNLGRMSAKAASVKNNRLSLKVTDKAMVLKLTPRR